jgi:hypothetical protein
MNSPHPPYQERIRQTRTAQLLLEQSSAFLDITKEPITYRVNQHSEYQAKHVLVPAEELFNEFVSVEELLDSIAKSEVIGTRSSLVSPFVVKTILPEGDLIIATEMSNALEQIELDESSSAGITPASVINEAMPIDLHRHKLLTRTGEDPAVGLESIREGFSCIETSPGWDITEILVKRESVDLTCRLLQSAIGSYLPSKTQIYVSSESYSGVDITFPCILVHSFNRNYSQLNALSESITRTKMFLENQGTGREEIQQLRILSIPSTGRSTRNQIYCRANDKLLMPGPKGIAPILMLIAVAYQLEFPCPGRWVINNDGVFLLSKKLCFSGHHLGVLGGRLLPLPNGYNARIKGHISSVYPDQGYTYVADFHEIPEASIKPHKENFSLGAYFVPQNLACEFESLAPFFPDRNMSIVFDIMLPYLLPRREWIKLTHRNGEGYRAHEFWEATSTIRELFPRVEFIHAGDKVIFRHFGSNAEFLEFIRETESNDYLGLFLDLPVWTNSG